MCQLGLGRLIILIKIITNPLNPYLETESGLVSRVMVVGCCYLGKAGLDKNNITLVLKLC